MECQVDKNEHFRHLLLFYFNQHVNAAEASRIICCVYGEKAVSERTAQKWFLKFNSGDFDLNDASRSGRPSDFNEDCLNQLIHDDPRQSTRELGQIMDCDHTTISRHLKKMGKVQKLGSWVPHLLKESHKNQRVSISASLLARHQDALHQHQSFLSRIVTGDEKWCLHVNLKHKRAWVSPQKQPESRAKPEVHQRKILLCVWWDQVGVIHYEILPRNQTINAELYCEQLKRVNTAIKAKRTNTKQIILQHDNARPHVATMTKLAIEELGWEVLPHPPYSPDLAPTDFHLFRSMSNHLSGLKFENEEAIATWIKEFFDQKSPRFFKRGIDKLPERWKEVIDCGGEYLTD